MTERQAQPDLLIRGNDAATGDVVTVSRDGGEWKYIDFRVVRLSVGQRRTAQTGNDEVVLVVIAGTVGVTSSAGAWELVGERVDPFSGPPAAIYLPAATSYEICAVSSAEVAICAAPSRGALPARLIQPAVDSEYTRGQGQAQRRIRNILMGEDEASSLFVTEVVTLPGNWSSYPPHKHDEDNPPVESQLEEVYYYRSKPAAGFAFQRVYTASGELDQTMTVHDCDAVLVPRGFHVCAAAEGYWIYYLNVLAGPKHVYHMTFDPAHAWIKEGWKW
jgi:5-deoxy-glucuronate isomerase